MSRANPAPLFRWLGAKWRLAEWIAANLPPHRTFLDAFGGSGAVLLSKAPAHLEVYNDLDSELVDLFRVARNPQLAEALAEQLALTPYAREEYEAAHEQAAGDIIEQSRRALVRGNMSHGAGAITGATPTGFKLKGVGNPAAAWARAPARLQAWTARLRQVVIEHSDALELMPRLDGPHTLHYVDPPYPHSTRRAAEQHQYRHEFSDEQHEALAHVLHGLKGMVLLSGYACPLYARLFPTWESITAPARDQAGNRRTETLWFNPAAAEALRTERASCAQEANV